MLPDWLLPSVESVRAECDVRARELFSLVDVTDENPEEADEAAVFTLIRSHIDKQAAKAWGELADESRSMPFPLTIKVLATAYPLDVEADEDEIKAQGETNKQIIENQKENARNLVKERVISKLWYSVTGDDAKQKGQNAFITSEQMIKSLTKQIRKIRRAYLSNQVELDPFY